VRLSAHDILPERLTQDLQDVASELWQFIQEEHTVVGQRHFARHRHVAPTDQPDMGDGVLGGATRPGRDQRRAVTGAAGDAVEEHGVEGFREGHRRPESGEPPGRHRRARPGG
jgi:hypothetical protein